jgi:hypothetical protein
MSIELNFPFTNPANYTYDDTKIDITGGKAKLKLQEVAIDFTEDFADDTDFTYDSDKAEFSGGQVQQTQQIPTDSVLYARWETDEDADYAYDDTAGTLNGTASIAGGKLSCTGEAVAYLDFPNTDQGNGDIFTVKFKWTPEYSGAPATEKHIYWNGGIANYNGAVMLIHSGANLYFYIYNSVGSVILSKSIAFSPVADTPYEVAITCDFTGANDSNVFIDGVLKDGGNISDTRGSTTIHRLGNDRTGAKLADQEYDDFIIYDVIMYTTNYTPGYSLTALYVETAVILPEMEHSGDGTIKLFNTFSTTESGAPRYTLQIGRSGDYLYWNGSAWATSDGTYTQANDAATFNTNCGSLDVDGEDYGQFKVIFPDSNTQSSVSELAANMNVESYLATNPTVEMITGFRTDVLEGFTETTTKTGSDEIKYIIKKGTAWYYWTGSAWAESDGTYSQANTATEIETNKASLVSASTQCYVKLFLHSADGTTSPEIDNLEIDYSYAGETPDTLSTCLVWGFCTDPEGNIVTDSFTVRLNKSIVQYKNYTSLIKGDDITVTPDSVGYWEVDLVENENMTAPDGEDVQYIFKFTINSEVNEFIRTVPDESTKAFYDLAS